MGGCCARWSSGLQPRVVPACACASRWLTLSLHLASRRPPRRRQRRPCSLLPPSRRWGRLLCCRRRVRRLLHLRSAWAAARGLPTVALFPFAGCNPPTRSPPGLPSPQTPAQLSAISRRAWCVSYATRGSRAGEMAWPPLSRPGDTPHPPYGAPPSLSPAVHSRAGRAPLRASPAAAACGPGASGGGGLAGHRVFAGFFPGGPGGATAHGFDADPVVSRGAQPSAVSIPARRQPLWQGASIAFPSG